MIDTLRGDTIVSSSNDFDSMISSMLARLLGIDSEDDRQKKNSNVSTSDINGKMPSLTPSKALVIAGLIGNVFTVDSILVDKNQRVEIVLSGILKQKTQLEKIMDQVGKMPFDEVLRSIVGRLL